MLLGAWSLILVSLACVRAMGWLTELIETCWGKVMLKTLALEWLVGPVGMCGSPST